jgi:hypothetical protein
MSEVMKTRGPYDNARSEFFALLPVICLLAAATFAKFGAAAPVIHLSH